MSLKGEGFCAVMEERMARSCTNVLTFPRPGPMAELLRSKGESFCAALHRNGQQRVLTGAAIQKSLLDKFH
jgi:hypothetical protein